MGGWLGGGHTYTYTPDYTIQNAAGERGRQLWSRYRDAYLGKLEELAGEIGAHPEEINRAQTVAENAADRSGAGLNQTLAMYGSQLNPMQVKAMESKLKANKSLSGIAARNNQRETINDRNEALTEEFIQEGSAIRNMSSSALTNAAALESARNQLGYSTAANKTAASQASANGLWSAVGTGVSLLPLIF